MADYYIPPETLTVITEETTELLDDSIYNRNPISMRLCVVTSFVIETEQQEEQIPYRVFYVEDKDVYVAFYKANEQYNETARVYLINGTTKEVITSYYYTMSLCPTFTAGDEAIDFCVHYTSLTILEFSIMVGNLQKRSVYVVRFRIDLTDQLMKAPKVNLDETNFIFFSIIVPEGAEDHEVALSFY